MDRTGPASQRLDPLSNRVFSGVNDAFAPYLGSAPKIIETDGYERRAVDKWNMPEAYRGKNLYLRDTIEDIMWTADQTWYTTVILPWKVTDELHIQWTNLTANAHLLDYTPYQGTSSNVTQERQIRRASMVRRGIGAEFEHDFLRTPMGRSSFLASLKQIARSVQETANIEVIRALVNAYAYQHEWQRQHGIIRNNDLKALQDSDRFRFACVQKTKNGLEKLDMEIEKEIQMANGYVDAWILPEEISMYATIVRPEKTDYYLGGQVAVDRVNAEGSRLSAAAGTTKPLDRAEPRHLVNRSAVYLARAFNMSDIGQLNLLTRTRQIGEYNTMIDETSNYAEYESSSRDIAIYNEDIDDFSKISLRDAIINCGLWDLPSPGGDDGPVKPLRLRQNEGGKLEDAKRDFLSYSRDDGSLDSCKVLYHIDPFYLPAQVLLDAAQTIEKALKTNNTYGQVKRKEDVAAIAGDVNTARAIQAILDVDVDTDIALGRDLDALEVEAEEAEVENMESQITQILMPGVNVPVVRTATTIIGNEASSSPTDAVDRGFFAMLADSVPSTKREEIETIAARDGPVMERVQLIKDQFNQYAEEKLRGFKLKSQDRVEDFFVDRIRAYQQALADAISSPRSSSSSGSSRQKIAGFMPPGKDLSGTEFRYLYEGSKRVSTGDRQADSNSVMRTLADQLYDAQRSSVAGSGPRARGATDGGMGMGLEGIGQLMYGTPTEALKGNYPALKAIYDTTKKTRAKHIEALNARGASPLQRNLAEIFLHVKITRESMLKLAANNILVPLNFLLFRPHMQYQMKMGIKCATGGRTGHMYYGSSNAMIQGEVSRKISKLHFTTHMRAVVEQPKNVYVQPDIYSEAYRGGNGIRFYTPETYRAKDMDQLYYSIICVAIPFAEREIPTPMDTSGRFYIEYSQGLLNAEQFEELHYSTAFRYNLLYGFFQQTKQQGGDGLVVHNVDNRQMYQGHQFMYNVKSKAFDKVRTNKGHWGPDVYAGVGQVRAGQLKHMREQDYTNYSVL